MAGFLQSFYSLHTLTNPSASSVAFYAARKAIELAMLSVVSESCSLLSIVAQHSDRHGPFARRIPAEAQFLYEASHKVPVGVASMDQEELKNLEQELTTNHFFPYLTQDIPDHARFHLEQNYSAYPYDLRILPERVNVIGGDAKDFETLRSWVDQLESVIKKDPVTADLINGHKRLSAGLSALLKLALDLNMTAEADELIVRIAGRIHASEQSEYLAMVRPAWDKYFLSGRLREELGLTEHEVKEYAAFVCETTRKRMEEGVQSPLDVYKDKSIKEMLEELDQNTVGSKEFERDLIEMGELQPYDEGEKEENEDERFSKKARHSAPTTILCPPATLEQISEAESTIGRPLPDDLKEFYALTNGVTHVNSYDILFYTRLPAVQSLFWEQEEYMAHYSCELLPWVDLPRDVEWPSLEDGGLAMYNKDHPLEYVWYLSGEVVEKAKTVLGKAYEGADEADKKVFDRLVEIHHGSWEQLRDMKSCWSYHVSQDDHTAIFHDFKGLLSLVLLESTVEKDCSPIKRLKEESYLSR